MLRKPASISRRRMIYSQGASLTRKEKETEFWTKNVLMAFIDFQIASSSKSLQISVRGTSAIGKVPVMQIADRR